MPRRTASDGPAIETGFPSKLTLPASIVWMPEIALTRVDLPAPLSPTSATTSPARASKSTSSKACTGPKRLLTPSSASRAPFEGSISALAPAEWRSGPPGAARFLPVLLRDSGRLACACVLARADVGGLQVAALDDGLGVVPEDCLRLVDHRRDLLLAVVDLLVDQVVRHLVAV